MLSSPPAALLESKTGSQTWISFSFGGQVCGAIFQTPTTVCEQMGWSMYDLHMDWRCCPHCFQTLWSHPRFFNVTWASRSSTLIEGAKRRDVPPLFSTTIGSHPKHELSLRSAMVKFGTSSLSSCSPHSLHGCFVAAPTWNSVAWQTQQHSNGTFQPEDLSLFCSRGLSCPF